MASAQRRTKDSFLQHGSILLTPASGRIVDYLPGPRISLSDRVTSISEELGEEVDPFLVRSAVVKAFEEIFRITFEKMRLSEREEREVLRREGEKRAESKVPLPREVAV